MTKNHLKRIATPRTWPIFRKLHTFVARPKSGKVQELSLPLAVVCKEVLGICETTRQVKALLQNRQIIVDGKVRNDHRYPVGLFDVISLVDEQKSYRLGLAKNGKLNAFAIDEKEKDIKIQKVLAKKIFGKDLVQLSMLNGRTIRIPMKDAKSISLGDTIVLDNSQKIVKHLPLKKGNTVKFIGGRHIGAIGKIEDTQHQKITVSLHDVPTETLKSYAFVVGTTKPEVKISE
ncbi:MAG: S4 domain-containing protein [Candidatus Woesearchaeota archaeon]